MDAYSLCRPGKLKLKGEKNKDRKRKRKDKKPVEISKPVISEDTINHGYWWEITKAEDITGPVAIEFAPHTYVNALDNGMFTLGVPRKVGQGPAQEEILTAVYINERKVALKSGYGKFLCANKDGTVVGRSDAIGMAEQWEPVFQDGHTALLSWNNCFMSIDNEDSLVAKSKRAQPGNFLRIRSHTYKEVNPLNDVPTEEQGNLRQIEINYVKKFQKFQDKRLRLCADDTKDLKDAKKQGSFHEILLDRRSKMKADRYCK